MLIKNIKYLKIIIFDCLSLIIGVIKTINIIKLKRTISIIKNINLIYNSNLIGMSRFSYNSRVINELITLNSLKYYTKNIDYFLDVGANVGMTAIAAEYLFNKQIKIYMFEPSIDCFKVLEKIEKRFERIKFLPYALGKENEKLNFNRSLSSKTSQASSFYNPTEFYKKNQKHASSSRIKDTVEVYRLDSLKNYFCLKKDQNIFLHIDVEGYELNVLKGSKSLVNNISIISLEYSNKLFDTSYSIQDIYSEIENTHEFLCALGKPMTNDDGLILVQDLVWVNRYFK